VILLTVLRVTAEYRVFRVDTELPEGQATVGTYVKTKRPVHDYPSYAQEGGAFLLYRGASGLWTLTASPEEDLYHSNGLYFSAKKGETPLGLQWRVLLDGKIPLDETLQVRDFTAEWEGAQADAFVRAGPPTPLVGQCEGGVGPAESPNKYEPVPATFTCLSNSSFCVNNSQVYCNFSKGLLLGLIGGLEEAVQDVSAELVVLEDELDLLDGAGQTEYLKKKVQDDLELASHRVYLLRPLLGLKTHIQVIDAILLFSVCASYGVAAGIVSAYLLDKTKKKRA